MLTAVTGINWETKEKDVSLICLQNMQMSSSVIRVATMPVIPL